MTNSQLPPVFETERLLLRPIQLADAESYEKNFVDYEVIAHLSALVPWPYPKGGVKEFLNSIIIPGQGTDRWTWVICLPTQPSEVIGCIDLWRDGAPEHRGFWLAKKYWNKGYMTEAVIPTTEFAFEKLGFERLIFTNAVGNKRSRRIKEKTGAKLIGTAPKNFVDPSYKEQEIWELTKEAWKV